MIIKTKKQWDNLERPLKEIDNLLLDLCNKEGLSFQKNYHNWPNRSLIWLTEDGVNRKLEIALNEKMEAFRCLGYAWYDDEFGKRKTKIIELEEDIHKPLQSLPSSKIIEYLRRIGDIKMVGL